MEVPLYVLDPRFDEETFIKITEVEPGSELAKAVVQAEENAVVSGESLKEANNRLHAIKRYLLPGSSFGNQFD